MMRIGGLLHHLLPHFANKNARISQNTGVNAGAIHVEFAAIPSRRW